MKKIIKEWFKKPNRQITESALKPVLLCTPGRSGGTLFIDVLSHHSSFVACAQWPHEQSPASYLMRVHRMLSLNQAMIPLEHYSDETLYKNERTPFYKGDRVEKKLFQIEALDPLEDVLKKACQGFYAELGKAYNKKSARFFIEKASPRTAMNFYEVFDETHIIFLLRDPRDAILSASMFFSRIKDHPYLDSNESDPLKSVATGPYRQTWKNYALALALLRSKKIPHLTIHYEKFITQPKHVIQQCLDFLGLELDESQLSACMEAFNRNQGEKQRKSHITSQNADDSLNRWKRELSVEQQDFLTKALGSIPQELGYS